MITAILALVAQASAYSLCNPNNYRLKDKVVQNVPIVSSGTFQNREGQRVSVTGSISVIDGCSFSVSGLTFAGVTSASLYGGIGEVGPDSPSVRLVNQVFNATTTPINQNYTFISSAGAAVSYSDFNQFRLYDPISQIVLGVATIPSDGLGVATIPSDGRPSPTTGVTSSSTSDSSSSSSTSTSSDIAAAAGIGLVLAPLLALL